LSGIVSSMRLFAIIANLRFQDIVDVGFLYSNWGEASKFEDKTGERAGAGTKA
jgi:hypothetical protein